MAEEFDISVVIAPEITLTATLSTLDLVVSESEEIAISSEVEPDPEIQASVSQETSTVVVINIGPPGPKGDTGDQGPDGPQGEGLQIDAAGPPEDLTLYDDATPPFAFLDTTNSLLYLKLSAAHADWSVGVLFGKGEKGDTGDTGADGNTILHGNINPTITDGKDGDYYINDATHYFFGPKNTTWPAGISLIGPAGADGQPGVDGADGPAGTPFTINAVDLFSNRSTYNNEDPGFNFLASDTSMLYVLLAAATWSTGIPFGKGDKGDTGETGADGAEGPQGIPGNDGADYTGPLILAQMTEPTDVPDGTIWIDTSQ